VLAAENYIDVLPQTGYVIRPVTLRSIHSTFDTHIVLASRAAESVRADARLVDEWQATIAARGGGDDATAAGTYLHGYMRLHFAIAARAANRRLQPLLTRLLHHHERLLRLCAAHGAAPAHLVGDDQPMLDAWRAGQWVAAGDAERARLQRCRDHVLNALVSPDNILDVAIRG
jgi:DNA-binding GntR family transcriptional regulator